MYCTVCRIEITSIDHYRSKLHGINANRRLLHYPPLSPDEFEGNLRTGDGWIDDYTLYISPTGRLHTDLQATETRRCQTIVTRDKVKACIFCNEVRSISHYETHNIMATQAYLLLEMRCFVCFEKFTNNDVLLKHLKSESHRLAILDGSTLTLDNGKVLFSNSMTFSWKNCAFMIHKDNRIGFKHTQLYRIPKSKNTGKKGRRTASRHRKLIPWIQRMLRFRRFNYSQTRIGKNVNTFRNL